MGQILNRIQVQVKSSSSSVFVSMLKFFSGFFLGLTFALIGQELMGYGNFSFLFVMAMVLLLFLRFSRGWSLVSLVIFDLMCVLVGLVLRMYIMIAPGA